VILGKVRALTNMSQSAQTSRSTQKQELEEVRGIKIPVFVQIFEKAALEQKNLDISSSTL